MSDRRPADLLVTAPCEHGATISAAYRSATTIERTSTGTFFTKGIDLEVTKIQEGLWEIRPTKSLEPGEYALATSDKDPVADFTIIEKGY